MLSKDGFKHHLINISHYTEMAVRYEKTEPELSKNCREQVEKSKAILIKDFENKLK